MRDLTINMIVPATGTHDFTPVPPVPPTPPPLPAAPLSLAACAIESPTNMWWPPGMAMGSNKFTSTVFHQGMGIAQDGHDCGALIPHLQVAPAPNNMLTPLVHIPFSSRKSMFVASTVAMDGKSPACCTMFGLPPSPMVYCANPMSPPLADAVTSYLNTVTVGMTLADFLIGAVTIAASMLIDKYMSPDGLTPGQQVAAGLLGGGSPAQIGAKAALSVASGLARAIFTDGPVSIAAPIGSPYLQIQPSADRAADGTWSGGFTGQVVAVSGQISTTGVTLTTSNPTGSTTQARKWDDPGPTKTTTDISPMQGFRTTTTSTDPSGNVSTADSGGRGSSSSMGDPL
ncbi:MAG TPA: hypothetical protein VMV81_04795 [Phycisphaerae bacterium]|nr:hypothetical protein [Phycisphaerae bacterium]